MKIQPLSNAMGAEVTGVDLNEPLSATERDRLYQAFLDHLLLCVRGQAFADVGAFLNAARHVPPSSAAKVGNSASAVEPECWGSSDQGTVHDHAFRRKWSVSCAAAGLGEQRGVVKMEFRLLNSFHRRTGAPFSLVTFSMEPCL
jgi:hypothetical protein